MAAKDPSIPNIEVNEDFVEFQKFVKKFEREYRNLEEFQIRFKIFCESRKNVKELNNTPGQTATFGINHFSDMTEHEKNCRLGFKSGMPTAK